MGTRKFHRHIVAIATVAAVLTAALWLFAPRPAAACSCEEMSRAAIERADAAVAGTVVAKDSIPPQWEGQDRFVATIEVTIDLKDNVADEIYLTSHEGNGANCGVTWTVGTQIATAVYEIDGILQTGACSGIPQALINTWLPATTVGGTATLLIGGEEPNRTVAYDQTGTPIAFAFEPGRVQAFSVCPGDELLLELVNQTDNSTTFDTRSLATFEITSSVPASIDGDPLTLWDVRCDSPDGSTAMTNGYALADGTLTASSVSLVESTFDPQSFWPELRTESTAPIRGESWMWRAVELDQPVTIEATGRSGPIAQLGSGDAFGLDETTQSGAAVDGDKNSNNRILWPIVVLVLLPLAVWGARALTRARR